MRQRRRRRSILPSWLLPTLLCALSIAAAVRLKLHFDELLQQAVAAPVPAAGADEEVAETPPGPVEEGGAGAGPAGPESERGAGSSGATPAGGSSGVAGSGIGGIGPVDGAGGAGLVPLVGGAGLWVDPASSGRPWSDLGAVEGLLTFRGNPTRTFHGRGPVPASPVVQWTLNVGCSDSPVADEPKLWCGSGWTGQPAVFQAAWTGQWWVAFGGYDRAVHFLDPATGVERLPPIATGDIIKGSVTVDPDGYPLLYTGSRDDYFHVVALDRSEPAELWRLWAHEVEPTMWNNDWDGAALVLDDHLIVGGENGRFFVVKLNRSYGGDGRVQVAPEIVFSTESWDDELLASIGDRAVSIESSVAVSGDTVYFANSGGLVQGWSLAPLDRGGPPEQVFRFWTGDDTDATVVVDSEGMLYAGSQYERGNQRSAELGQIFKLDPSKPDDPLVWSAAANEGIGTGVWATPALYGDLLIVATDGGNVLGLDRATGDERWRVTLPGPLWSSPVVVDHTLVQADCAGRLHAFDLSADTPQPPELWTLQLQGCLESTPAVWDGQIFIGSRNGLFYAIGNAATTRS